MSKPRKVMNGKKAHDKVMKQVGKQRPMARQMQQVAKQSKPKARALEDDADREMGIPSGYGNK